jgi:hypothetical protein
VHPFPIKRTGQTPTAHLVSPSSSLHSPRATFRKNWTDCRLQTAEQHLLKLYREDDTPGYLIPQLWTDWLRHGESRGLRGIVEHNCTDVLSLVALASVLGRTYNVPAQYGADPLGVARAHRRVRQSCERTHAFARS